MLANECELRNSGEGADKSALTHEGTAKEVRSTSNCSFAPWGEGQDEGSYKLDATGMTPHQVRTKLAKRSLSPTILSPSGEELRDVTRHSATEPKNVKDLTSYRLNVLTSSTKAAFTLAEVLITLAVIGIVAVLTIPGLIKNHNERTWSTAQSVFEKRLEVATKQMNTEEKLAGYANTMDFVNELKKYIKITKVCDSNDLSKCFESKILTADGQEVEAYNLKTSAQMAVDDWGTETVGVQFANGINALIAYNPNTDQQPFNNQFSATEASMAILYDVSGHKNPNTLGKDVNQNANVTNLGCRINPDLVGGMCITKILAPGTGFSPMTSLECTSLRLAEEELGITTCFSFVGATEYWAAAVKACGGVNKMPSPEQLTELAKYIYNTDMIPSDGNINNLVMDPEKAAPFLAVTPMASKTSFYAWANQHYADKARYASSRFYGDSSTFWENESSRDARNRIAICTDN